MARVAYLTPTDYSLSNTGERTRFRQIHDSIDRSGHTVMSYVAERLPASRTVGFPGLSAPSARRPVRITPSAELARIDDFVRTERIDLVIATHPAFVDLVSMQGNWGVPVVIDTQNFEASWGMFRARRRGLLRHGLIGISELLYLRQASRVWTLSTSDARRYRSTYRLDHVQYVPFIMPLRARAPASESGVPERSREVLFVGNFGYKPNAVAARFLIEDVAPHLARLQPAATVVLVGLNPTAEMLGSSAANVKVVGEVPTMEPYYQRASVVVAPLSSGGGIKLKVLEALSHAKPLVASAQALSGLDVRDGVHVARVELHGRSFARAISEVLDDDTGAARLAEAGYRYVTAQHSSAALDDVIANEIRQLTERSGPR